MNTLQTTVPDFARFSGFGYQIAPLGPDLKSLFRRLCTKMGGRGT